MTGLTDQQVAESRQRYGANILTPPEKETLWMRLTTVCRHPISVFMAVITVATVIAAALLATAMGPQIWVMPAIAAVASLMILVVGFFGGFKDPLFQILITAFVLSIGISVYEFEGAGKDFTTFFEPIGIIAALLLATGVAYFLERSNEKTFQSLNEVNDDTMVKVIRNANVCQVPRKDIVVGDIVILETGEEVPADATLLEALNLTVNESSLTGEPQATKTTIEKDFDPEATYPSNHILKGTTIIEGYCTSRVTSVGDSTECGKVFVAAQVEEGDPTPLSRKLDALAMLITRTSYLIAVLIIIGRIIMYFVEGGNDFATTEAWIDFVSFVLNTIMIAVTLIVVAVPEGLPMSVTLSLAFSMRKLMRENTLPRTMHSCETMGAASVICTDKTGTLTQNSMQVYEAVTATADARVTPEALAEMIAVNTTANIDFSDAKARAIGNPTEGALLLWLNDRGTRYDALRTAMPVIDRLPFSTENKYMATVIDSKAMHHRVLYVKGAPEILIAMAGVSADERARYDALLAGYQHKAMRTLALAYAVIDDDEAPFADGHLSARQLSIAAIFAISDPVRSEVPDAINSCLSAGIDVKIVTGDTPGTAMEIGRQIGLWTDADGDGNIMSGTDFAQLDDATLLQRVEDLKILSRARPNDKERLVRLLRQQGRVVAVTGDGTNDAPALNAADVGLSMGDGTAVAKEASDMTIQDNSFSTIANAVMWGRSLYRNIQRFIMYQMTINVVACLIVLIGAFTGTESPLTVTQMLWVNLIMDTFAAIALASLPPSHSVMADAPRSVTESIVSRPMARHVILVGTIFTAVLLLLLIVFQHSDIHGLTDLATVSIGRYDGLSEYELSLFFTVFVMLQFWNIFNAKAFMTTGSAFARLSECRGFMTIAAVIFFGQILIVEFGGRMFNVCHLNPQDWLIIILATCPVLVVGEVVRRIYNIR